MSEWIGFGIIVLGGGIFIVDAVGALFFPDKCNGLHRLWGGECPKQKKKA